MNNNYCYKYKHFCGKIFKSAIFFNFPFVDENFYKIDYQWLTDVLNALLSYSNCL